MGPDGNMDGAAQIYGSVDTKGKYNKSAFDCKPEAVRSNARNTYFI